MTEQPHKPIIDVMEETAGDLLARWEMGMIPDGDGAALVKAACECVDEQMQVEDDHILDAYSMMVGGILVSVSIHLGKTGLPKDAPES